MAGGNVHECLAPRSGSARVRPAIVHERHPAHGHGHLRRYRAVSSFEADSPARSARSKRSACPCIHGPPSTLDNLLGTHSVRRDSSSRCAGDGLGAKRRTGSGERVQRGTSAWRPSAIASSRASDGVLAGRGNAPERRGSGAHSGPSTVCNPLRQAKWGGQSLARAGCLGSLPCHAAGRVRRTARRRPYRASGRVPYRGRRVRFDQGKPAIASQWSPCERSDQATTGHRLGRRPLINATNGGTHGRAYRGVGRKWGCSATLEAASCAL